jgi:hypothetical protein
VSGAARLWYAIDDERRILWLTSAGMGHQKRPIVRVVVNVGELLTFVRDMSRQ